MAYLQPQSHRITTLEAQPQPHHLVPVSNGKALWMPTKSFSTLDD